MVRTALAIAALAVGLTLLVGAVLRAQDPRLTVGRDGRGARVAAVETRPLRRHRPSPHRRARAAPLRRPRHRAPRCDVHALPGDRTRRGAPNRRRRDHAPPLPLLARVPAAGVPSRARRLAVSAALRTHRLPCGLRLVASARRHLAAARGRFAARAVRRCPAEVAQRRNATSGNRLPGSAPPARPPARGAVARRGARLCEGAAAPGRSSAAGQPRSRTAGPSSSGRSPPCATRRWAGTPPSAGARSTCLRGSSARAARRRLPGGSPGRAERPHAPRWSGSWTTSSEG